jgi:hypothetical protein
MTRIKTASCLVLAAALASIAAGRAAAADFRPPAVPLVTYNPFLSIWSESDQLYGSTTKHWTRHNHSLVSLVRIDGKAYRLMGAEPKSVPPLEQKSVEVLPTRSVYEFEGAGVHVQMVFMQPALPDDLDVYSWPLSYITWQVRSSDGGKHEVQLYDSTSSQLVVNSTRERVEWSRSTSGDLTLLRVGTKTQNVLGSCGDDHRINWGYAYAAAQSKQSKSAIGAAEKLEDQFVQSGSLPTADDTDMPRAVNSAEPVLAFTFDLGSVGAEAVQRQVIVAYDEIYAIKYYGQKLLPYWARNDVKIDKLLETASSDYPKLLARCEKFDRELMEDMTKVGGEKYAKITALAYRECVAANGLAADANKQPLFFTKENTSNGDIATVDVFFPMDPIWIFLSPSLAKASLVHVLMYSASPHWKFPNAPHDLGTYPLVFGRDDGGEGMPVEESGNMLILCDAIAHADGNPDFVAPWWPQLTQWANYLEKYGLDPENQLCTDDFMGHLAHNANLSVKAILGLAAYGDLCRMRGDKETAEKYFALAKADAQHWMKVAAQADHYRLAFDKPGTWSQKYNLVWDRLLGLNIFPPSVAEKEIAHYKKVMLRYGVPLDSRTHLTKTDWCFWSATMAENQADFEAIINPIYDYLNETTVRDPIADSYETDKAGRGGMHARPVVGGFFIKMLSDRDIWKKWAARDTLKPANWAPLPVAPQVKIIVPLQQRWRFTTAKPADNWTKPDFDASGWSAGRAGFGTDPPGFIRHTNWNTDDIWLRREMTVPQGDHRGLQFVCYHDEDVEIYVNGSLAAEESGFVTSYVPMEISREAREQMKPGAKILVAVHCHQTVGGQGIDVGLADVSPGSQASATTPRPDARLHSQAESHTNRFYVYNRAPLAPSPLVTLPIGAVHPKGWLLVYLQRQREGLTGKLGEISAWLQKENNAWLSPNGKGEFGWEEVPYWLRGYIQLAYLLDDPKMIAESQVWIEGALHSQRPDGDFGPDQRFSNGARDYWANMLMLYCLQTYYEHSGDRRVIHLMTKYFHYQLSVPDDRFLVDYWQHMRGGDNMYIVHWLYNITGDPLLLNLAEKLHRRTANWDQHYTLPNWHNVNIAQAFREPATWYRQTKNPWDLQASYDVQYNVRKLYGQVPGGMFGADENARPGYSDPRQAIETCGAVEQMLSDELMLCFTADAMWGDHCEDVAFNTYPAAVMPDFRSLRYLTAPNMAVSDDKNHSPGIENGGPFLMMNPFSSRCCQHNHSQGWPYFAKHLWMATPDNGLCAAIYSASEVSAKVGAGTVVHIAEDTHYPFEHTLRFSVKLDKSVAFPLYFRIPGWCAAAELSVNGKPAGVPTPKEDFACIDRTWQDGDTVTLKLPMKISLRTWEQNHNSVSVDYGPLTFSLRIAQRLERKDSTKTAIGDSHWQKGADASQWPSWEIYPASPWNYGLVLNASNPAGSFSIEKRDWPASNFPFTLDEVPIMMTAKARKIPEWTLDHYGLVAPLQDSPAYSDQPIETVTLVPMGAARLRISAFPTIGDPTTANRWSASADTQSAGVQAPRK